MPLLLRKAVLRRSLKASAVPCDGDSAGHHRPRQQLLTDASWSRSPSSWSALLLTWLPFYPPGVRLRTREPSGHILDHVTYAAICVLVSHSLSAHWSHSGSPILLMSVAPGAPSRSSSSACQWPMRRRAERSWALFAGIRCWTEGLVGSGLELQLPGGALLQGLALASSAATAGRPEASCPRPGAGSPHPCAATHAPAHCSSHKCRRAHSTIPDP